MAKICLKSPKGHHSILEEWLCQNESTREAQLQNNAQHVRKMCQIQESLRELERGPCKNVVKNLAKLWRHELLKLDREEARILSQISKMCQQLAKSICMTGGPQSLSLPTKPGGITPVVVRSDEIMPPSSKSSGLLRKWESLSQAHLTTDFETSAKRSPPTVSSQCGERGNNHPSSRMALPSSGCRSRSSDMRGGVRRHKKSWGWSEDDGRIFLQEVNLALHAKRATRPTGWRSKLIQSIWMKSTIANREEIEQRLNEYIEQGQHRRRIKEVVTAWREAQKESHKSSSAINEVQDNQKQPPEQQVTTKLGSTDKAKLQEWQELKQYKAKLKETDSIIARVKRQIKCAHQSSKP